MTDTDKPKMKLSEAIREGIKLLPHQSFGKYFAKLSPDGKTYTNSFGRVPDCGCVIGTAAAGLAGDLNLLPKDGVCFYIDKLVQPGPKGYFPFSYLLELNDDKRWTREQIADWLEQQGW